MPRVVHFEIPADNPERAASFYKSVFDWDITKWDGPTDYWLVMTGEEGTPGINGGLLKRQHPDQPPVNTIDVESVDDFLKKVTDNGGEIAVPKMPVPGVGWLAYCKDTEGNIFGIMQSDRSVE
jgi:predicted enzyme related to lactoylglutathione lyase